MLYNVCYIMFKKGYFIYFIYILYKAYNTKYFLVKKTYSENISL